MVVKPAVGLYPYCIKDSLLLQIFIHIGGGEGGISPEVELFADILVPIHDGFQEITLAVSGVYVTRPQFSPLAITELIEDKQGVVASR